MFISKKNYEAGNYGNAKSDPQDAMLTDPGYVEEYKKPKYQNVNIREDFVFEYDENVGDCGGELSYPIECPSSFGCSDGLTRRGVECPLVQNEYNIDLKKMPPLVGVGQYESEFIYPLYKSTSESGDYVYSGRDGVRYMLVQSEPKQVFKKSSSRE